jgi:hypothetical protein
LIEKDAPTAEDAEHRQSQLAPAAQIAVLLHKLPGFGPQMGQELIQIGINAFDLIGINRRPAILAADAVAAATKDALKRRFGRIDDRQAAPH